MSQGTTQRTPVWKGRPSISSYVALYGILTLVVIGVLIGLELWTASLMPVISSVMTGSLRFGSVTVPYALEVSTAALVLLVYLAKVLGLVIFRARNSYELQSDGLYLNKGIANLQNTFISAMAFTDARLVRTIGMRLVGRSQIIVEANDGRRFVLKMLKDGESVQELIRANLSHPTVRIEK